MSTESIAISTPSAPVSSVQCAGCGAPLAGDQRYCLQCGEPRVPMSSFLLGGEPFAAAAQAPPPPGPPPELRPPAGDGAQRANSTLTVIAGVGVLLLAIGIGILIGRSGNGAPKQLAAAPEPVITVAEPATSGTAPTSEATFTSGWPVGTSGYTVQLKTLPQAGTAPSAVEAAKTEATSKGAKEVGALESDEYSSLPAGDYVVYSGVDHSKMAAEKTLSAIKKSFPGASVIKVSSIGSPAAGASGGDSASQSGAGSNEGHPATPTVLKSLSKVHGKNYEEKSKSLPDVVETG